MNQTQQDQHDQHAKFMNDLLGFSKEALAGLTTAGVVIVEAENPGEDNGSQWFWTHWGTTIQQVALHRLINIKDRKGGHGLTAADVEAFNEIYRDVSEHTRAGVIFAVTSEGTETISTAHVFWGDRLAALGLIELWKARTLVRLEGGKGTDPLNPNDD